MRVIHSLQHWGAPYLLVACMIGAGIWQQTLPVPSLDHTLLLVFILVVFGFLINAWVSLHETNFLVPPSEIYEKYERIEQIEPETRSEKTK